MAFLLISFVAGVLTVLAPCILPLLPVVIGSSASGRSRATPYIVVGSLAVSIILFTFLLKASTAFIMVPASTWAYLSGGILMLFGLTLVFPSLWESLPGLSRLSAGSNKLVGTAHFKKSAWGDVLVGAALGPVFSTCSPTYFVILASVLPVSFALGTTYLLAYVLGLSLVLLLIALLGERFVGRLSAFSDPRGWAKRGIGVLFLLIGLAIVTGYEKKLEASILAGGFFDVTTIEQRLLSQTEPGGAQEAGTVVPYTEIVDPSGFVNTDGVTIGQFVGKKVILVDFLTYSCINCQRTFPYLNAWYDKYKDAGLQIIGIHTPEFAFEHDINNVRTAMQGFGIMFPIVLDNDYATWRAYGNRFWPHKYLIDIQGNVVYDHIGEGGYDETEMKIRELLMDRAVRLGETVSLDSTLAAPSVPGATPSAQSPETYFGSKRNKTLGNGTPLVAGMVTLIAPKDIARDTLYLAGTWNIMPEYAQGTKGASVFYHYNAKDVYLVAHADPNATIDVLVDGEPVTTMRGADVGTDGVLTVSESRLYTVIHQEHAEDHVLELRVLKGEPELYTFTFG